jgi:hypothetical protein
MTNGTTKTSKFPLLNDRQSPKQNGFPEYPLTSSTTTPNASPKLPPGMNIITPPNSFVPSTNGSSGVKPLMADTNLYDTLDAFDEFRRMAAQIHQQFNAPYSKVINAASAASGTMPVSDGTQVNGGSEKNTRPLLSTVQNKSFPMGTFIKSWKIEHSAGE